VGDAGGGAERTPVADAPAREPSGAAPAAGRGSVLGNRAVAAVVARGAGLGEGGVVHPEVRGAIAQARGGGRPLDDAVRTDLEAGFGEPLDDVRVHTGPTADALTQAVSARAFAVGRDVWFAEGEYAPGHESGRRLLAHEVAHAVQQGPADVPADLRVTSPGDGTEREADALGDAALARAALPGAPAPAPPAVSRAPLSPGAKLLLGYRRAMRRLPDKALERADNIASALQGPPAALQLGQTLAQGQNGMSPMTLPARLMSRSDQDRLKQIVQFRLINGYCARLKTALDAEAAAGAPAAAPSGAGPAPAPPAPGPAPPAPAPTGAVPAETIDAAMLEAIGIGVQADLENRWTRGRWPEGHEYVWSESGDASTDKDFRKDRVGVTGSVVFSNLVGQALTDTAALDAAATHFEIALPSPGPLTVRMLGGGTLGRGASWTNSWWDNLAVNATSAGENEDGPDRSVALPISTKWLWDDNQTVWDFVLSIGADGAPRVEDAKSGTPDDSKFAGFGEGGTPQNLRPSDGGLQNPGVARLARHPRAGALAGRTAPAARYSPPVLARAPIAAAAVAALKVAVEFLGTDLAAAIAAGTQAATAVAGTVVGAFQHGQNGCATLQLTPNQMSTKDQQRLRQLIQFRVINAYTKQHLDRHPEVRKALQDARAGAGATPGASGAPAPAPGPAPAPAPAPPAPSPAPAPAPAPAAATPSGVPTASAIDGAIAEAVRNSVSMEVNRDWVRGVAPVKEYVWSEGGESSKEGRVRDEVFGVVGAIAFNQLRGETLSGTPVLEDDARLLGLTLAPPGEITVRRITGGSLDRGGQWSDSWYDNLAVNMSAPVVTEDGPDGSVAMRIGTDWLWDDNATVWDFVVTVQKNGVPLVDDEKSGTPDDSSLFGEGEGGTHTYVTPSSGSTRSTVATPGKQGAAKKHQ